jgi:hypothetical protein
MRILAPRILERGTDGDSCRLGRRVQHNGRGHCRLLGWTKGLYVKNLTVVVESNKLVGYRINSKISFVVEE